MFIKFIKGIFYIQLRNYSAISETFPKITESSCVPQVHCETKVLKVAVIGLPNAGKSTFINNLMDRKVCAASQKVHTTRGKAHAVFTEGDAQIVFVDTPGLVNDKDLKRYNLEKSFIRDSKKVSRDADIIGVIHDVTNVWTRERLDIKAIKLLELHENKPSFLVLNKVDALKSKRKLLDLTRQLTENYIEGKLNPNLQPLKDTHTENKAWRNFSEIFMVSSLTGDGLRQVKDYLIQNAKPGEWIFPQTTWTDQSTQLIIENTVKAALLDFLPQELPYDMQVQMELLNEREDGSIITKLIVKCPSPRKAQLAAGASDGRLKQIIQKVQQDLQETFYNYVNVQIVFKS